MLKSSDKRGSLSSSIPLVNDDLITKLTCHSPAVFRSTEFL